MSYDFVARSDSPFEAGTVRSAISRALGVAEGEALYWRNDSADDTPQQWVSVYVERSVDRSASARAAPRNADTVFIHTNVVIQGPGWASQDCVFRVAAALASSLVFGPSTSRTVSTSTTFGIRSRWSASPAQ